MNKSIASLIVGAFSAAAFATSPVAPVATPATVAPAAAAAPAAPAAKAEAKKVVKEKTAVVKTDATKKVEVKAPAAALK